MKKYKFPSTTIHKVVCNKCKAELDNKIPESSLNINEKSLILSCIPVLPIDFMIERNEISFHCNTCNNEDDFEIITLGSILDDFFNV